jgi:hypothetical protein
MRHRGVLATAALATTAVLLAPGAQAAIVTAPHTVAQKAWDTYGNSGKGWTGGQLSAAAALPDGRTAYAFGGSYLGPVAKNGSRPANAPYVHSLYVVTNKAGVPTRTVVGSNNTDLFSAPLPQTYYEPAGAIVDGNTLYQMLWVDDFNGDFPPLRIDMAVISLPSFTIKSITPNVLPLTPVVPGTPRGPAAGSGTYPVIWGSALAQDAKYTYAFGYERDQADINCWVHVARIPRGQLTTGTWEYLDVNGGWTSAAAPLSARIFGGGYVGEAHFSVVKTAQGWRATAQGYLTSNFYVWTTDQLQATWTARYLYKGISEKTAEFSGIPSDLYPIELPQYEKKSNQLVFSYIDDAGAGNRTANVKKFRPLFITATGT